LDSVRHNLDYHGGACEPVMSTETLTVGCNDRNRELATRGILPSAVIVERSGFFQWSSAFVSLVDRLPGRPPRALVTLAGLKPGAGWNGFETFTSLEMCHCPRGVRIQLEIET
jgi:hypothetical protein